MYQTIRCEKQDGIAIVTPHSTNRLCSNNAPGTVPHRAPLSLSPSHRCYASFTGWLTASSVCSTFSSIRSDEKRFTRQMFVCASIV